MVRNERFCSRAAWNNLQHWRFHFNVVTGSQEVADTVNNFASNHKRFTGFFAGDQVNITLAILGFLIGQAVEFFR